MSQNSLDHPPGYQGSAEGGVLTNAVRANPYTVILFDEVEKAHADVFKLFLQIFDDGRLTNAKGMTVSFSFTTIIMTSNLGARNLDKDEISKLPPEKVQAYVRSKMEPEVKKFFPPELINRLDDVLYFNFLSRDTVKAIAKSKISKILERFVKKGKQIEIAEDVYRYLVEHGFNPESGARFLNRTIEAFLLKPLTKYLLSNPTEAKVYCRTEKQRDAVSLRPSSSTLS
ncbi:MAG TPA: AAA family ATPase [Candidatus Omnitrophota bacterium]|nr:AAA family ATPase [Candidatus Omnitrophota bacterium]